MPAKNDLLQAMTGHASTNKWDIVCSYNADIINNILKEKYGRQWTVAAEVRLKGSYEDPFRGEVMLDADLVLHEPELQFIAGTSNVCRLSMPIVSGLYTLTPKDDPGKAELCSIDPNVLQVAADFPLAAVSGDTEEVHDGTQPIVFKDSTITAQQVFLHFKNVSETTFDIVPVPSEKEDAPEKAICQENIRPEIIMLIARFFKEKVSEIDYPMGEISNAAIKTDVITIHPKSFIFSLLAPDHKTPDNSSAVCLNLYIQSAESGNPPGDANPSFRPAGNTISPVPDGYTASLILSGDFMGKLMVSYWNKETKFCLNADGFSIQLNIGAIYCYPGYYYDNCDYFDGITVPNTPAKLSFSQDKLNVALVSSSSGKYAVPFVMEGNYSAQMGTITASFEVNETFDLKLAPDGKLLIEFKFDQSGIKKVDTVNSIIDPFGENLITKKIRDKIKSSLASTTGFSVSMKLIDMLAVSNLLFPVKNRLNFAGGDSFYVPQDFIVFGNIK